MKKNVLILTVFMVGGIVFGVEPKTNNETNSNSNSKRVEEKEIYPGIYEPFVEKVQIVNMAEVLGQTFIIEGKAYIVMEGNVLYKGHVNSQGRIDLEEKLLFKKMDDNCITVDGKTCFTVRSSTMLPEIIRISDGKTIEIGKWKNPKFHKFLMEWKNK
jgi:hypothetical protein